MLESLSIPHYSPQKGSDNMLGADNQQERLRTVGWIVGFVDGEGCFSVTIQKATTATGWQVFPEFVVTQGERACKHCMISKSSSNVERSLSIAAMTITESSFIASVFVRLRI
jgi:hypothetical protein